MYRLCFGVTINSVLTLKIIHEFLSLLEQIFMQLQACIMWNYVSKRWFKGRRKCITFNIAVSQIRSKAGQHSWDIISLLLSIRTSIQIISKVHCHSIWKKLDTQGDWPFCKNFGLAHTSECNTTLNYTQWHA